MKPLGLVFLVACGSFDGRVAASAEVMPHARPAVDALNAAFGCGVVSLGEAGEPAWGNGRSEVYFSSEMYAGFDGFTRGNDGDAERDIMVRPRAPLPGKPARYDRVVLHELGHAFGLEHEDADGPGEVMHEDAGDYADPGVMSRFVASLASHGVRCEGGR